MSKQTKVIEKMITFNYSVPIEEKGFYNSEFVIAGTAINATTTSNNHKFLPEVLRDSAKTLIGVPLLVDHENKVENIKGRVFYADYDLVGQRIPFKAKVMDNEIKEMIKDGRLNSVSVGACVNPKDIEEDENGCIIPKNIIFKELSLVAVPADQGATFQVAMNQAFKLKQEEDLPDLPELPDEDEETEKENIVTKDNYKDVRRLEMSEQEAKVEEVKTLEVKETKAEIKEDKTLELQNMIKSLTEQVMSLTKKMEEKNVEKVQPIIEETEDIEESEKSEEFSIVQEFGEMKGGAFTLIRNKY